MSSKHFICKVCGGNEFELTEGFYHCTECYIRHEDVQEVVYEPDYDTKEDKKHSKVHKVANNASKVEISSWECYNFILRGLVEELISNGAKKELEAMALQIWAAYLRSLEVAFFSEGEKELPKLNARYIKHDAEVIYNIQSSKSTKRKRDSVLISETQQTGSSTRDWRQKKNKLDESLYKESSFGDTSANQSFNPSQTAINITFNSRSLKYIKSESVKMESTDNETYNECAKMPRVQDMHRLEHMYSVMNIKQLYSILAIALNLIQDNIQLCDLVNFIQQGHVGGTYNVMKYFPDIIAASGNGILKKIDFYNYPIKYSEKCIRSHTSLFCKNLGINRLRTPQFINLVKRYALDLCLPSTVSTYAEKLIKALPPLFNTRVNGYYPAYEARAMAYIIFVLKLIFGLDDCKEIKISEKAKVLNETISALNLKNNTSEPLLFVWTDWMQYIEMRNIIIDTFNPACRERSRTELYENSDLLTQNIDKEIAENMEKYADNEKENSGVFGQRINYLQRIFKDLLKRFENDDKSSVSNVYLPVIKFEPSVLPSTTNLETILNFVDNLSEEKVAKLPVKIPEYIRENHLSLDMRAFVNAQHLKQFLERHNYNLEITQIPVQSKREYVGIFYTPTANKNISSSVEKNRIDDTIDLQFTTNYRQYSASYNRSVTAKKRKLLKIGQKLPENTEPLPPDAASNSTAPKNIKKEKSEQQTGEPFIKCEKPTKAKADKSLELCVSNMDCWSLMGVVMHLSMSQKGQLLHKLPLSFRWLINVCAKTLGVEWFVIYEQLLVIELMLGMGVEDLSNFKSCIYMKSHHPLRDFNILIRSYREIW